MGTLANNFFAPHPAQMEQNQHSSRDMSLADGAMSNHVVFLAPDHALQKCAFLYLDSPHQLTAKLCDLLLGNWLLCSSCLQTQDENSICRLQRNQELKSCGGERECNILRLSHVLLTLGTSLTVVYYVLLFKKIVIKNIFCHNICKSGVFCFIYFHSDRQLTETVGLPPLSPTPSHKSLTWLSADIYRWRGCQGTAKC